MKQLWKGAVCIVISAHMEQCGYSWAYFHEIFSVGGIAVLSVRQAQFLVSLTKTTHFKPKYICDMLHPNLAENSCRDRL